MVRHNILLARFMFLVLRDWQSGVGRLVSEAKSSPSKPCRNDSFVLNCQAQIRIAFSLAHHITGSYVHGDSSLLHSADVCSCSDKRRRLEHGETDSHFFSLKKYASVRPTRVTCRMVWAEKLQIRLEMMNNWMVGKMNEMVSALDHLAARLPGCFQPLQHRPDPLPVCLSHDVPQSC